MKKLIKVLKSVDWKKLLLPYIYCIICGVAAVIIINGDWSFIPSNVLQYVLSWFKLVVIIAEVATIIYVTIVIIFNIYKRLK